MTAVTKQTLHFTYFGELHYITLMVMFSTLGVITYCVISEQEVMFVLNIEQEIDLA